MKLFLYKRGDIISHRELGRTLQELPTGEYVVSIKKNLPIRSLKQNRYLHFAIKILAIHTGFTHEEIYEIAKFKFNGKMINLPKGGTQVIGQSTKDMDTKEFTIFVNRYCKWCQDEFGISIPQPGDLDLMKRMEIENLYSRTFSGF